MRIEEFKSMGSFLQTLAVTTSNIFLLLFAIQYFFFFKKHYSLAVRNAHNVVCGDSQMLQYLYNVLQFLI